MIICPQDLVSYAVVEVFGISKSPEVWEGGFPCVGMEKPVLEFREEGPTVT